MYSILAVFIGGGLGSLCRFGISRLTLAVIRSDFPFGTLLSNAISCLVLALVVNQYVQKESLTADPTVKFLLITGFCGGFSTFSTFSLRASV